MWRLMSDAQVRAGAASPLQRASLDPVATADQQMAQASADFSRAVDPLLGTLRLFEQNDYAKAVEPVAQCVRDFAAGNLGRVDQLVSASRLYAPDTGSGDADFFNLGPLPVTKDYLARQIARSQILAGYATPFLAVLQNTEPHNEAQRPNQQSAAYWSNSIAELNSYTQTQEPNGQVGHLHDLFLKSFSGINAANCGKELASYQAPEPGNDMFSARREQLENRIRWTCSDHGRTQAYASYFELAARFDRELRGRYPFGPPGSADAQPATVRSFFADYQNKRAALRALAAAQQGPGWDRVRGFIASLDAAADFFKTLLPADDAAQPARLAVTFRALPDASPGSDQLVNWALTSGAHSIGYPNRIGPLDWYVGQPLVLDLTWANRSPWLPAADPRQADLQRDGASASFSAAGEWALLRLVERHRARGAASDDGGLDPARVLLEFAVPVVPAANPPGVAADHWARMHLAVSLSAKDAKTQAATTLRLPAQFPRFAPPFPQFPTQEASWTQRSSNARKNTL
jgi:type VI secretion system protein ImpL